MVVAEGGTYVWNVERVQGDYCDLYLAGGRVEDPMAHGRSRGGVMARALLNLILRSLD